MCVLCVCVCVCVCVCERERERERQRERERERQTDRQAGVAGMSSDRDRAVPDAASQAITVISCSQGCT